MQFPLITSSHNPKIQWVRGLQARSRQRRESQVFVAEGVRLAEEALTAGWQAQLVLVSQDTNPRGLATASSFADLGAEVIQVSPQVMRAASDTQTPQGILLVLPIKTLPLETDPDFLFIPDGVRDPGNLGTMLRTAAAAGVDAVLLPPGTVDLWAPKVVRSAMGAHFRLSCFNETWDEIRTRLQSAHTNVYLASASAGRPYTQANFSQPAAIIIGGEAEGAGLEAYQLGGSEVHIPMPGGTESLNAAAAAAILLFEVVRQRTQPTSLSPAQHGENP